MSMSVDCCQSFLVTTALCTTCRHRRCQAPRFECHYCSSPTSPEYVTAYHCLHYIIILNYLTLYMFQFTSCKWQLNHPTTFDTLVINLYTPHSVSPSPQRLLSTAAGLHGFLRLSSRRYDVLLRCCGRCPDDWNIGTAAADNSHRC